MKPKLLLHICCIACGAHVAKELEGEYEVALFFMNPNIFPAEELERRFKETERVAAEFGLPLFEGRRDHGSWREQVKGREADPEGGERCAICYEHRLRATAEAAKESGITNFASTLTVSPHKNAAVLNTIGERLAGEYGLGFVARDFKKKDGFKKACALSRDLGLYRQDYCGCEFSK
jgi:hypothetical protein